MYSFKAGDLASLKSGSAKFTIEKIDEDVATIVWMDADENFHRDAVNVEALILINKDDDTIDVTKGEPLNG